MADDPQPGLGNAELHERATTPLAMGDDPVEAVEEAPPRACVTRGAAGQQVVGRKDERPAGVQEPGIHLRHRDPLEVEQVAVDGCQAGEGTRVAESLGDEAPAP